jgi:hypothetical protein
VDVVASVARDDHFQKKVKVGEMLIWFTPRSSD